MPDPHFCWTSQPKQQNNHMIDQPASFNELLINEVKAHPQLYDQQHRVCTDNGERNVIWEVIAQRIDESVTGEFAKKRWLQMRDRYRKELKMALRTSVQPKWPYFTKLSWLDPYLKDAKSIKSESNSPPNQPNELARLKAADFPTPLASKFPVGVDKDREHNLQFPQLQNVNLLETLIAASRELLERQREKLTDQPTANGHQQQQQFEFSSPDSAVASTSEEGWENQQQQQLLSITGVENNMEEEEGEEERSEGGIDGVADQQQQREEEEQEEKINGTAADHNAHQQRQDRICSISQLISQRLSRAVHATSNPIMMAAANAASLASPAQLDITSLLNSTARLDNFVGAFPADSLHQASHNNSSNDQQQQQQQRFRGRNLPSSPYLVRRGSVAKQQQFRGVEKCRTQPNSAMSTPRKFDIASVFSTENNNNNHQQNDNTNGSHHLLAASIGLQPSAEQLPNAADWARMDSDNDEDLLFARLVLARLKKFDLRKRREIRSQFHQWLDQTEEDVEMMEQQQQQEEQEKQQRNPND